MPEYSGSSAIFCATTVVFGFNVPVENPMAPPSRMMAAPVIESRPIASASITITGANAMNMLTACVVQIRPNISVRIGINTYRLLENFFASFAITACSEPDCVSMWKAAPENRITSMISTRFTNAFTIYIGIRNGFTGVRST